MRVVVADDHALFRDGITSLLEASDYEVVAQVENGVEALAAVEQLRPDLVLLDIIMPGMSGLETLRRIKELFPETRVVMLTILQEDRELFEAIQAGADGFLHKDIKADEFLHILTRLRHGELAITKSIASRLIQRYRQVTPNNKAGPPLLSERELEVLRLLGRGLSNRLIAEQLFVSENTVKYHIRNIFQKLGVKNRTEAVSHALQAGLIPSEKE